MIKHVLNIFFIIITLQPLAALDYKWGSLPSGGGGYVTGIVFHTAEENLIYIRTDVGGIYRYEAPNAEHPANPRWIQLMDWIPVESKSLWSTDGIALNPQNTDEVYAALGVGAGSNWINTDPYPQGVYKSSDRGNTWKQVLNVRYRGNQSSRSTGECIAVVPEGTGNVVLAGTRFDGIYRSEDGGARWTKLSSVPGDALGIGVRSITIDPTNVNKIYASVSDKGVYQSLDKGLTFTLIEGSPVNPRGLNVDKNGVLWIASKTGLWKYANGTLVQNNPSTTVADYNMITIDPNDANHVVVTQMNSAYNTKIYRTTNGGSTWTTISDSKSFTNHVPWYKPEQVGAAVAGIAFNPFDTKQLWLTDWYLPWKINDVTATSRKYESIPWGVEELVIFDIVTPPTEAILYNGCADNGGLKHTSMTTYPTIKFGEQESTGLDFCEADPKCIVRVSSNGWGVSNFRVSRSLDAGSTWKTVHTPTVTGKMAISSKNKQNYIYIPTGSSKTPLVTKNDGANWANVTGLPVTTYNGDFWNNWNKALVSDRINGDKFYALISGKFYTSENGGESFAVKNSNLVSPYSGESPATYMVCSPYAEGEVWASIGGRGLYVTKNGGTSFDKINDFTNSKIVAIGPPMTGNTPIVYTYARHSSQGWGIYCSLNGGTEWQKINDEQNQVSNNPRQMAADRSVPGRIFIGSGGSGIYTGTCVDAVTKVMTPMITPYGGALESNTRITIKSFPEDAVIYYTVDGSEPTSLSARYTEPFAIGPAAVVKAISVKNGLQDSDAATSIFVNNSVSAVSSLKYKDLDVRYDSVNRTIIIPGMESSVSFNLRNLRGELLQNGVVETMGKEIDVARYPMQVVVLSLIEKNETCFQKKILIQ